MYRNMKILGDKLMKRMYLMAMSLLSTSLFLTACGDNEEKYSEYFGFTDSEVDQLYEKYTRNTREIYISREDLKEWYDGYTTKSGERMYNPRSVVLALTNINDIGRGSNSKDSGICSSFDEFND